MNLQRIHPCTYLGLFLSGPIFICRNCCNNNDKKTQKLSGLKTDRPWRLEVQDEVVGRVPSDSARNGLSQVSLLDSTWPSPECVSGSMLLFFKDTSQVGLGYDLILTNRIHNHPIFKKGYI